MGWKPAPLIAAVIYAVFGTAWILASDSVVGWLFPAAESITHAQTIKGLAYVAVTAVLVYALVAMGRRGSEKGHQWYRRLFELTPDAAFVTGEDGRFVDANATAIERYGYSREELLEMGPADLSPADLRDEVPARLRETMGKPMRFEWRHVTKDGRELTVEVAATPVQPDGRRMALSLVRDVTEERHLQRQLIEARKMDAVGRLAGGIAHDFNNMLQTILGYTDLALTDLGEAHPQAAQLREIRAAAERSAELTRQLLAFARKQTVSPVPLELNEAVGGLLTMLQRLIGEDIDLLWQPCRESPRVEMDPAQLDQVLANLVVNARDAICDNGRVTIETALKTFDDAYCRTHAGFKPGRHAMLAVSDDGEGMDGETVQQVFEPFFSTRGDGEGAGLGLATVYGIVRQNDGFVNVYSEPGEGTTFRIYLPVLEAEVPRDAEGADSETPRPAAGGETVLLVEDEPALLKLAKALLTKLGYRVLAASRPSEALRLAEEHGDEIDMLLTDVVMPEMSGRMLWERLKQDRPDLPCLFMSGYTANVIAHHNVLDEGIHFLAKPFSPAELAGKLRDVLAEG